MNDDTAAGKPPFSLCITGVADGSPQPEPWVPGPTFTAIRDAFLAEPEVFVGGLALVVGLLCPRRERLCLGIAIAAFGVKAERDKTKATNRKEVMK